MPAQGYIPFQSNDPSGLQIPKGLTTTTTPQGGTAYTDSTGTYGTPGAMYLKQSNGYFLAPQALPGNSSAAPGPGQGNNPVQTGIPTQTQVQPTGTTIKQAPVAPASNPASGSPNQPQTSSTGQSGAPATDSSGNPVPAQKTAAQVQAEADALASAPIAPSTGTRTSASIESDFQKQLDAIGSAPTAPDANAVQAQQQAIPGGVNDIQNNINTLTKQYNDLQTQIQGEQAGEASKPGVIAAIINGRMKMISAEDAKAMSDLKSQITSANTQLSQANTAVAAFMRNTQTDYTNASAAYNKAYSDALTQYHDQQTQLNQEQTSARANAQVIINSFKGGVANANPITADELTQWTTLEQQAGLPAGTIQAAVQNELNITKFVKGSDGNEYAVGIDNNGVPYTAKIGSAGGTTAQANVNVPSKTSLSPVSGTWTKTQLQSFTNQFGAQLDGLKGTDKAVSNTDYNAAKANWIKLGGTPAAFDTAFKQYQSKNPQAS